MKLTKLHRVLKFKKCNWLEKHINFNTVKRENAADKFSQNFFKLMVIRIYGETIENLRKIINSKLISNSKDYVRSVSKPNLISQKIFSKNLVAIHQIKPVLTLNKPIYVGFSILDLSKLFVYKLHYGYIKDKFDAKLLFTDTDSVIYEIKGENVYEDFYAEKDLLDFSDNTVNSKIFDPENKKVIDKMKD